jgi:hypothetical protein
VNGRPEDLWSSERQVGARRSREVNRRRDCGSTQAQISGPRLDCSRLNGFGESGRTAGCTARTVTEPMAHGTRPHRKNKVGVVEKHRPPSFTRSRDSLQLLRSANYSDTDPEPKTCPNAVSRIFDLSLYYAELNRAVYRPMIVTSPAECGGAQSMACEFAVDKTESKGKTLV